MCHKCPSECSSCYKSSTDPRYCKCAAYTLHANTLIQINISRDTFEDNTVASDNETSNRSDEQFPFDDEFDSLGERCVLECGKGTFELIPRTQNASGVCERCHPLCDSGYTCSGPAATQCIKCRVGGLERDSGEIVSFAKNI
jgi:hypothetical protein